MLNIWQNFKFVIHVFRILGVLKQPLGGALIIIRIRIAGLKSAKGLEQQGFNTFLSSYRGEGDWKFTLIDQVTCSIWGRNNFLAA